MKKIFDDKARGGVVGDIKAAGVAAVDAGGRAAAGAAEFAANVGEKARAGAASASEAAVSAGEKALAGAADLGQKLSKAAILFGKKAGAVAAGAAGAVGEKAAELGEKGKLAIEIKKLEAKATNLISALGYETYIILVENGLTDVNAENAAIKPILEELREISKVIDEKEAQAANV
jgi:hypothetical protein